MITHGMIFVAVYLAVLLVFTNTKSWESMESILRFVGMFIMYPLVAFILTLLAFWGK